MGRRDAVQVTLEIVARCRHYLPDLIVTYEPGWETRGNGTSANYDYGTMHHTASASSLVKPFPTRTILRDGRAGLSGPLCNSAGPACTVDAPRLHINAAHPANHAGASRRSGPVPALSLFNPRTWGHEIDYAGSSPMMAGQELVGRVLTRAVADVLAGGNVEHIRAHAETSVTGKWDPGYASGRTVDMAAWRARAAAVTAPSATPPTPQKEPEVGIAVVNLAPGEQVAITRPECRQVILAFTWDGQGIDIPDYDGGVQQVRAARRLANGSGWHALMPAELSNKADPNQFWLGGGEGPSFRHELDPGYDKFVLSNLHPAWYLTLTITAKD